MQFPIKIFPKSISIRRRSLSLGCCICCPSVTFNKKFISFPLFANDNFRSDVDWQAWETLSKKKGKFIYINKGLVLHRIHNDSETTKVLSEKKRSKEDLVILKKFWPDFIDKCICKIYSFSEMSNQKK